MAFWDRFFGKALPQPVKTMLRAYKAASNNRLNGWVSKNTSADAEIKSSVVRLRDSSRALVRDNDYAKSALRSIVNNVVGSGIGVQPQVKMQRGNKLNDAVNASIRDAWYQWTARENCHTGGQLSFSDIERLAIRSTVESGEVFIRMVKGKFGRSKVPVALEIIEADQLDLEYTVERGGVGNSIRMGVERDQWQRPIAYYFLTGHPGDASIGASSRQRTRVPASEVIHLYLIERPGQTRGVPWFHTAILRMIQLGGYEEAEIIRARAESAIMGFIESPEGDALTDGELNSQDVADVEPGIIKRLLPGDKFTSHVPNRAGGAFDPFVRAMLRGIAAGVGVSYEALSKDYSQSNYSSSRLALLDDRDQWRVLQNWLIETLHYRVYEEWLDMAVVMGAVKIDSASYQSMKDQYQLVRFKPRGWSWVDPEKELNAARTGLRLGLTTRADIIAEQGGDINDINNQLILEKEFSNSEGLVFDGDPSKVNGSGAAQYVAPQSSANPPA